MDSTVFVVMVSSRAARKRRRPYKQHPCDQGRDPLSVEDLDRDLRAGSRRFNLPPPPDL